MRVTTARDLGYVVRERRSVEGWSQGELAKRAGTSRVTVNKVETGHAGAALFTVLRLLGALGLQLEVNPKPSSRLDVFLDDYVSIQDDFTVARPDAQAQASLEDESPDRPGSDLERDE